MRQNNDEVTFPLSVQDLEEVDKLTTALKEFREEKGFGRGIAAPQIGINKRFISLDLGKGSFCLFNPEIITHSEDTSLLWDDCMSFPDLVVKVKRFRSISIRYMDENGQARTWDIDDFARSELLQHEIDHLDGIMAIDRAVDIESILYKPVYMTNREYFQDSL